MAHQSVDRNESRRIFISLLGWLTIGLAFLMAILPRRTPESAESIIGALLLVAGILEMLVGVLAGKWSKTWVLASGLLTGVAAFVVLFAGPHTFFSLSAIVSLWLIGRASALLVLAFRAPWRTARTWLLASGTSNFLLALLAIVITMSITLTHLLFGPSPRGEGYSAIPALSLLFNGISFAAAAIGLLPTSRRTAQPLCIEAGEP